MKKKKQDRHMRGEKCCVGVWGTMNALKRGSSPGEENARKNGLNVKNRGLGGKGRASGSRKKGGKGNKSRLEEEGEN